MTPALHTTEVKIPGFTTYEHQLTVPLDHKGTLLSESERTQLPATIRVFAREYVRDGGAELPRLVYFQGGPGSPSPRPEPVGGFVECLLEKYRVLLLDERGTGLSHALDATVVTDVGTPELQAAYLSCFRADSIVDDAEALRIALQGEEPWSTLGQSFGGFCITTYLSRAPQGLKEAMITAGLPSVDRSATDVYERTWEQTEQRNREFFDRYPEDEATCWKIVQHLADVKEFLPTGERLTPRRFRMIGISLGWSYGLEKLHHLLEDPFVEIGGKTKLRGRFLVSMGEQLSFGGSPLYWALHESIYAQCSSGATEWAANRVRQTLPQFHVPDIHLGSAGEKELEEQMQRSGFGFRFSGEHVFPWQGEEDPALVGLAPATELLAQRADFPALHDAQVLAQNSVPVAAWIYRNDMFVPFEVSMETANRIRGLVPLISEDYHHDALRTDSARVVGELLKALHD
ncbi:alpha/beta fold hydrolase [Arcanobacterium ihumii]|uniref:alpha/beta fold hydrolase n=1 Tax=Arcanobacterium ihumii TaxID=2138162 RepID=UPI000F51CFDE|nr:alpha/beta fold hydrolase [Arcanobacterium ihumii]